MELKKIAVLGSGVMGRDIAGLFARSGYQLIMYGRNPGHLQQAKAEISEGLARSVKKGKISSEDSEKILAGISQTDSLGDLKDADFVIEALSENAELKKEYFSQLEGLCREECIFATNTSSLSITGLASALKKKDRFIGTHFFHPTSAMKLCEMIPAAETSEDCCIATRALLDSLGRITVRVNKDVPGFIVNRVLFAYFIECIRLYEEGIASKEDIDLAMRYGLNHPLGPFNLMDMGGLDTFPEVCKSLQTIDPERFRCPESILKLYEEGRFGTKVKKGWYEYE